jgi:AcrR family transcriptional regulator
VSRDRSVRTRTAILDAARRLLEERGGAGDIRLEDIAAAAGVSRQAVYLHFGSRSGLLLALVAYVDEVEELGELARPVREAASGVEELEAFVGLQAEYTPRIYAAARAVDELRRRDEAMAAAWNDRMARRREACARIVARLAQEGSLALGWTTSEAADALFALTSIRTWEDLVVDRRLSKRCYTELVTRLAVRALVAGKP